MRLWALLLVALALATVSTVHASAQERITAAAGISIEMPSGWSVVPAAPSVEKLRGISCRTPEFERGVQANDAPFITLTKAPADPAAVAPVMTVTVRYLSDPKLGAGPIRMLADSVETKRRLFPGLELLDAPRQANFTGAVGGHVRIAYMLKRGSGEARETISETWITQRGVYAVVLTVEYDADEAPRTLLEIDGAVRSLWIDDSGPPPSLWGPGGP